ncbi:MAG TPA: carboxymuconolactone decarboxylase family protein [Stellaceae bacterium]|jgi:AhpD family alkylhydroperoxidase
MRENYRAIAPDAIKKLVELSTLVHHSSLPAGLVDLVYLRVSQINGCAYCVDSHTKDALAAGEKPQRLYNMTVWRETPFFTTQERAALAWAEAMTALPNGHPSEALHEETRRHFSEKEFVDLTFAIATINALNRVGVGFQGSPQPWK